MGWNVLITARSFGMGDPEAARILTELGCSVNLASQDHRVSEESLEKMMADVDAVIVGSDPVTERVLSQATRLRVISKHGTGVDNIDMAACSRRKIVVTRVPGANSESVADLTMTFILSLARSLIQADSTVKRGGWQRIIGLELTDKTLGLIGFGAIGRAVAKRARAFGMEVCAHDPLLDDKTASECGVMADSLDGVLRRSDFLSLHVPLTPSTRGLMNADRLAMMKPGAFLINTSRGEVVDERALYECLASGALGGAALDVFQKEPPTGSPILSLPNVICTPHYAAYTREALSRMDRISVENIAEAMKGSKPKFVVNPEVYEGRGWREPAG